MCNGRTQESCAADGRCGTAYSAAADCGASQESPSLVGLEVYTTQTSGWAKVVAAGACNTCRTLTMQPSIDRSTAASNFEREGSGQQLMYVHLHAQQLRDQAAYSS